MGLPTSGRSFCQDWVLSRPFMQQAVMMGALRGPDGMGKGHAVKDIIRWCRRCTTITAFDGMVLTTPGEPRGAKWTGPTQHAGGIDGAVADFMDDVDALPHHYLVHLMHAAECVAYGHPDYNIASWWYDFYEGLSKGLHLGVESSADFNKRLGGTVAGWLERDVVGITDAWAPGFDSGGGA